MYIHKDNCKRACSLVPRPGDEANGHDDNEAANDELSKCFVVYDEMWCQ